VTVLFHKAGSIQCLRCGLQRSHWEYQKNKQPRSEYRMHTAENAELSSRGSVGSRQDTDSAM